MINNIINNEYIVREKEEYIMIRPKLKGGTEM